ncbi:MAG: carbamoyl transferase, partial [bacterium]|nr:carbamoyl transferase [bacterium]
MYILGINSAYHESSASLVKDGVLLAAVEEERFSRIKHAKPALIDNADQLPEQAMDFCLRKAGIGWDDIDHIAFSFSPEKRLKRNVGLPGSEKLTPGDWGTKEGEEAFYASNMRAKQKLTARAKNAQFHFIDHHLCHAGSAYYVAPYDEACVITVDGIGEFASTWMGYGKNSELVSLKEIDYPNSLGFLWEKFSEYLGFDRYSGPGKLMGYSAITDSIGQTGVDYLSRMREIVTPESMGFTLDNRILRFRTGDFTGLESLFGPRRNRVVYRNEEAAIASALQEMTEAIMVHLAQQLYKKVKDQLGHPVTNLCLAGGVALNCLANSAIL